MQTTHFWYSIYKTRIGWAWVVVALFQGENLTSIKEIRRGWAPIKALAEVCGYNEIMKVYKNLEGAELAD